jgi:YHS domain-containing protein
MKATEELDRVCGMWIDKESAPFQSLFKGKTYCFCSKPCKEHFDQNPEMYMKGFAGRNP